MPHGVYLTLATLNGDMFLADQIESLRRQSMEQWTLLIRDDGSKDRTQEIIEEFAADDTRIKILDASLSSARSPVGNFSNLLMSAFERGARYVFSCDQDDVWAADKLASMLDRIKSVEGDGSIPVLLHHDLAVVDEELRPIAESYWSMMQISPGDERNPQRLLSRNEVTGCAMACNRALLQLALPIPDEAIMHDWWLALFAGFFGKLVPLQQAFVKYRQHGANAIGVKSYRAGLNPLQNWFATWMGGNEEFLETVRQARAFRNSIAGRAVLEATLRRALDAYCELPDLGRLQRMSTLRRCGVWRHNWVLDTVLVLRMLLLPRKLR